MNALTPLNDFTPNAGQQAAEDGFFEFLLDDKQQMMIISGDGGVGKSWLTGRLIDRTIPHYQKVCAVMGEKAVYEEVVVTATTNKAAAVTSEAIRRPAMTIYSFLNLTPKVNYTTGRTYLQKTRQWKVHTNKIIFIDECSMVDSDLLGEIQEATLNCKIVFVGDHCQLGPVNESISPIYALGLPTFVLTEPVRNAGQPALVRVCRQLRNTVETGIFQPIQLVPGVIDHLDDGAAQIEIADTFLSHNQNSRILAYTNQRVIEFNTHIRDLRALPDEFTTGEWLINVSAFAQRRGGETQRMRIEEEVEIIDQAPCTEQYLVETPFQGPEVTLEVRRTSLRTKLGGLLESVPVPVDREHHLALIKYYGQQKKWERHYHLRENIPDLRPRDAATVHKAQGSTYDSVFIDLDNLSTCHQPLTAARLLNVAFGRARHRVCLHGTLAEKYGGIAA
ncbi:ATP-dependent DNA helicase [Roseococcus sp.]|uniref:ATP-dependent DNA helicase n=1 Tax=Roseococcus sp. TaxID=2109646 RepID=UPI003BA84901